MHPAEKEVVCLSVLEGRIHPHHIEGLAVSILEENRPAAKWVRHSSRRPAAERLIRPVTSNGRNPLLQNAHRLHRYDQRRRAAGSGTHRDDGL
jgi:hypothetical protein